MCCDIVYLACSKGMVKKCESASHKYKNKTNEMFSELGCIMKDTLNIEVDDAINTFFSKFADEHKFLHYFHKNRVVDDKIHKGTNP